MTELQAVKEETQTRDRDKLIVPLIIGLSIIVPLVVAALLLFPDTFKLELGIDRSTLPAFHAILNGSTAALLILGLWFIRSKKVTAHRTTMIMAFSLSAIFLVSYVISKTNADPIHFGGEGWCATSTFLCWFPIFCFSIPVLPLAMFAIYRGINMELPRHRKIVRWAFPIWLYVAITGVLVYLFMSPYY
ncbi:MAG: DUF420 domain-containing protein [Owenweeksia sp.]|nr:DUF420 domain-containing protein [Owenweeksia sp.]